ncbi:hypothetical protein [Massilia glaciei]|uniref:Uncharacterized protein n=1 Tax=Massilia glaciei TaxID=1524097 RepID=A0A2U2HMQ0_9BURK|nr:hypothetical protein [Massilia glaciei]PWF48777.1 hypothetical protein C7C56_009890 [Massilia glaciei]
MNALKHMEAIFLAAVVLAMGAVASDAGAATAAARSANNSQVSVAGESKMAVVTITAKRLSVAAKAQAR